MLQTAFSWRNYIWHALDVRAKAAAIRKVEATSTAETVEAGRTWGSVFESGPFVRHDVRCTIAELVAWLMREKPRYLVCYPSIMAEIARICQSDGLELPFLDRILSFGECLGTDQRALFKRALGADTIDCYSTIECGCLALQCPESGNYHVMAEAVILEVLDERNRPCRPGQIGRVVVTVLHNFATPLIRYDLGDYAEVGAACPCGRGLPVLTRILGRRRNLLVLPDGTRRWPIYSSMKILDGTPIRQFQLAQTNLETIEARLVVTRPLSPAETSAFEHALLAQLRHPFRIEYRYLDEISRGPGGKYEDFRCEIAGTGC
jgi:phenylacetate-CoA ligase